MNKPKRLRRKDPVRKEPIRNPTTYFRGSESWKDRTSNQARNASKGKSASDSMDDVVTHGVNLGYEVIEKYLRQGQRVAEELTNGSHSAKSKDNDWEKMVDNMLRLYRDMSGFWIDAIEVLMRSPEFLSTVVGVFGSNVKAKFQNDQEDLNPAVNGENVKVAVEITSKKPAQVTLDIRPHPIQSILHVHSLHAHDPKIPPLTDVSFRADGNLAGPVLALSIPDHQPAATYTGVVVDQKTNEARGTICVRLLP